MDQETRENPIIEPEGSPEGEQKQPLEGLRRFLRTIHQKTEPARARFIRGRNAFCRGIRFAFDAVAAFFLKIWTVIGPVCKKIAHAVAAAAKAVWKVLGPLFQDRKSVV